MELMYTSTRNANEKVTASQAILKGLAEDGGLFVPEQLPTLDKTVDELAGMTYQETAYEVMKKFLTDFTEEELKNCINAAYDSKFDTEEIAPLVQADGAYYLELFHGSTIAFKDMALSILPHLMITSARKNQVKNDIVILTATSGDTGKAAERQEGSPLSMPRREEKRSIPTMLPVTFAPAKLPWGEWSATPIPPGGR